MLARAIEEIDRPPTLVGTQHPLCRCVEEPEVSGIEML